MTNDPVQLRGSMSPSGTSLRRNKRRVHRPPAATTGSGRPSSPRFGFRPSDFFRISDFGFRVSLWLLAAGAVLAADKPPADDWLTGQVQYPPGVVSNQACRCQFESLHADVLAEQLRVVWWAGASGSNDTVTLWVSADEVGHWPARDWHPHPMPARGDARERVVPVDSPDVPLVYFVSVVSSTGTNLSLPRVAHPRRLGLEEPTRVFWPFLEGFEEGLESWRLLTDEVPALRADPAAHTGKAALAVRVPRGKRAVTVGTTSLRGWFAQEHGATGVSLWLRTRAGTARARFTMLSQAFTARQTVTPGTVEASLEPAWQRVDLPFASFPGLALGELDLFTIEFIAAGPAEFLVDDLQLLGRWRSD